LRSWAQPKTPEASSTEGSTVASAPSPTPETVWDWVRAHRWLVGGCLAAVIVIGGGVLLYRAAKGGPIPKIQQLGPSFFFWLAMMYTALLLLMGGIYNVSVLDLKPTLVGGILPVAVPWFGALGAVTISLEGVFLHNQEWDRRHNYWHIGRPLFGAVLGIVAFFLFVVIGSAAGTPPKFLDSAPGSADAPPLKDFIIYYVLAFLVGYREETFRELIKRATDLILKPGTPPPAAAAVTFTLGGAPQQQIQFAATAGGHAAAPVTVGVLNSGNAPLMAPVVTVTPGAGTPASAFATANDHVTGAGDLAVNQSRNVDVTFTAPAAGGPDFTATLSVAATNLPQPTTIQVTGRRAP